MTVVVFTCVLGDTDTLRACRKVPNVRYLCFADRSLNVPPYDIVPHTAGELGPKLESRRLKILADHPALLEADVTLWHDAAYQLSCNPQTLADTYLTTCDVVAMRHPHRDRIEDEAAAIARLGYMPLDTLTRQIAHYRADGFLAQRTITSTGFCLRRRTPAVEAWQQTWWAEVARWGYRDQMSVDYALWRTGLTIGYIPGHYKDNPHARWFSTDAAREAARRFQIVNSPPIRRPVVPVVPRRSRYG